MTNFVFENRARIYSLHAPKPVKTKYNFCCLITSNRKRVQVCSFNHQPTLIAPCSLHAEMCAIQKHLQQINRWKPFLKVLRTSYTAAGPKESVTQKLETAQRIAQNWINHHQYHYHNIKMNLRVYRFWDDGQLSQAKPCVECLRWVWCAQAVGVYYRVLYSDDRGVIREFRLGVDEPCRYLPKEVYIK